MQFHDGSDFAQVEFFLVVEAEDKPLVLGIFFIPSATTFSNSERSRIRSGDS